MFAFDEHADLGPGLAALLERVEQGIVEILDIELIGRDEAGVLTEAEFETQKQRILAAS